MARKLLLLAVVVSIVLFQFRVNLVSAQDNNKESGFEETEELTIADPIEPWNRLMFQFNDRLYFWVVKPVAKAYSFVLPQDDRVAIRNFLDNLLFPVRFVNCILQGKLKAAGNELLRFGINTTAGVFGFDDVAKKEFDLKGSKEDLGQSLAHYGAGHGFYIVWPVLGPSSLRDTIGLVGDYLLDPLSYIELKTSLAIRTGGYVNSASLHIGDYEDLVQGALDPYISLQDAYVQHRAKEVEK